MSNDEMMNELSLWTLNVMSLQTKNKMSLLDNKTIGAPQHIILDIDFTCLKNYNFYE